MIRVLTNTDVKPASLHLHASSFLERDAEDELHRMIWHSPGMVIPECPDCQAKSENE